VVNMQFHYVFFTFVLWYLVDRVCQTMVVYCHFFWFIFGKLSRVIFILWCCSNHAFVLIHSQQLLCSVWCQNVLMIIDLYGQVSPSTRYFSALCGSCNAFDVVYCIYFAHGVATLFSFLHRFRHKHLWDEKGWNTGGQITDTTRPFH